MSNRRGHNYVIPIRPVPREKIAYPIRPPDLPRRISPLIRPTPLRKHSLSKRKRSDAPEDEPNVKDIELFERVRSQVEKTRILPKGTRELHGKRANMQYHLKNLRTWLKRGPSKYTAEMTTSMDWYRSIMHDYESNKLPLDVYYLLNNHSQWTWEQKPEPNFHRSVQLKPQAFRTYDKTDPNKALLQYNIKQVQHNEDLKTRAKTWKMSVLKKFIENRDDPSTLICVGCNKDMTRQAAKKHTRQACFRNKHGNLKCIYCHKEFGDIKTRLAHEPKCYHIERVVTVN